MSAVKLTIFENVSTFESLRPFHPFIDSDGLPFPLYVNGYWKATISIVLLFTLIEGTRLRIVILSYLSSPETKLGSVNYLIWIDQINGFFLGYTIIARIMFIVSPYPASDLLYWASTSARSTFSSSRSTYQPPMSGAVSSQFSESFSSRLRTG